MGQEQEQEQELDLGVAHANMVQKQIKPWSVSNGKILSLLASIPREKFVPAEYRSFAYADMQIPLVHGQHMLAPKVVGRILQALNPMQIDFALEIGTGTGYLTALLASLCAHVTTVEMHRDIADVAQVNLQACNIKNVLMQITNGITEFKYRKRFDIVVLTGSVAKIPQDIYNMVAVGGKLFAIVGDLPIMQATIYTKLNTDSWSRRRLFETTATPLIGLPLETAFKF